MNRRLAVVNVGQPVELYGTATPETDGTQVAAGSVTIYLRGALASETLTAVSDSDGAWSTFWKPSTPGDWQVRVVTLATNGAEVAVDQGQILVNPSNQA